MQTNAVQTDQPTKPNPHDPTDPAWEVIRKTIQQKLDAKAVNQRTLSKEAGVNETALNQFINGTKSNTRYDRVAERLQNWLETHQRRLQAQQEMPDDPPFLYTPTAKAIEDTLIFAHMAPDIALVYGASGVGKTAVFREYVRNNAGVCLSTMTPAHATVNKSLEEIGECLSVRPYRDSKTLFKEICRRLRDTRGLLIIDEAQNLGNKALDQIRQIHDEAECGIVLAGNDMVYTNMTGRRATYLDRVVSRSGMKTRIKKSAHGDKQIYVDAWGIKDEVAQKLLYQIAEKPGALRLVRKVMKLAHMISDSHDIQARHIRAAWNRLSHDEG